QVLGARFFPDFIAPLEIGQGLLEPAVGPENLLVYLDASLAPDQSGAPDSSGVAP
ncbi:MAG: hypothetical protein HGB05_19920, partial [Chloroflexi bacterium]|nr:hypothetical protein [Chloroflexota bacterium]